ncbi:nucleotidyltransferase family protein [Longimicrobium terrae]|uniref:NDP-sugar pyrophosphorylase family protein n=1 Tax=Longimicrobium terrae TaxID=1639882 RepID=A0A841H6R5_9BACT|nr:nucleotidyltransferase family protein [Longimicrobium terrae]MBB4638173.1 NDP-sugar pyrophosphorylase family protein [Longimicrobium terrae]MBB6073668.1 NDP-sugar pyrophosphorylase family protein [Longimicrobium terrae]NNC30346.1 nucleotidyltransferase family protein [Longimicrobium terrae]
MDAMILAAGLGTRLRPLTDHTPKAMIEVGGVPMLERVARRLIAAGADRLIINTAYLAEQIEDYVRAHDGFGVEAVFSREDPGPLETGGALLAARPLFRRDGPFFLHNADIATDLSLDDLLAAHHAAGDPLVTVAVLDRPSARKLLFDEDGLLGRVDESKGVDLRVRPARGAVTALPFAGVHVLSPRFLDLLTETGAFSILEPYLRLAAAGERIMPYRVDGCAWLDIGRPEQLEAARQRFPA